MYALKRLDIIKFFNHKDLDKNMDVLKRLGGLKRILKELSSSMDKGLLLDEIQIAHRRQEYGKGLVLLLL